ncbi:hypothetical protein DY000_02009906 [Brassica cretica]|uniref:Uncharacterized protein n=1 Tax=Brassica cretica TaxID=69181 RepID=A0ABQ7CJX5_BRACR|nr:hypothetical protein DY000_02009906 [Brassica cretica]
MKDEDPTHRPKTQKVNRRGSKLRHIIFHVYDRPAINEHVSRRGTTSFHRNQRRRWNSADGEDEPQNNQSSQGLEPKSQNWRIYDSEIEHRRLQSILHLRLSCMKGSDIFEDTNKLEDAKTKSIGKENSRRQRSTSSGRALPELDRTQYRFGVQKRQGSFRMGRKSNPDGGCHHRPVLPLGLPRPDN